MSLVPARPTTPPPPAPSPETTRGTSSLRSRLDRRGAPYLYIAPFFLIFTAFGIFPILFTAYVSLHDWHILGGQEFIGLGNYRAIMADPRFWTAVRNTLSILVLSTVPQLLLALLLAHLLHEKIRAGHWFRLGLLVPNVTSVVVVALVFESIFGLRYGLLNAGIEAVGLERVNFLAGTFTSHVAISTMVLWRWTGYNAILYLAGLQAVPDDLYEAAEVDGASGWQRFRRITIPLLRPLIIFTVLISTINGLQIFAEPLVLWTGVTGGPSRQGSTVTLFLYEQGFRRFQLGYASAIAWILFGIIVVVALVNYLWTRRIGGGES